MDFDRMSLNGPWLYRLDADDVLDAQELSESNEGPWGEMVIPTNWQLAGLKDYAGTTWFKREFSLPRGCDERQIWLRFHGVDYYADVWLNGHYLGHHEGYFQPFEFNAVALQFLEGTVNESSFQVSEIGGDT